MIFDVLSQVGSLPIWKQERLVALMRSQSAVVSIRFWTDLHGSVSAPFATYKTQADGRCYIDLTDYVRAFPSVSELHFYDEANKDETTINCSVVGLINPKNLLIPFVQEDVLIVPPSVMVVDDAVGEVRVGFYPEDAQDSFDIRLVVGAVIRAITDGMVLPNSFYASFILRKTTSSPYTIVKRYTPQQKKCGVEYMLVRWQSMTGNTYQHWMEVTKQTIESAGDYSLLPIDNEYVTIKGREEGLTLRLDGLDRYDLWYYSNIIVSSKVEVSRDGTNWAQVDVETNSITLPDGEAGMQGKLEIKLKYKRYDAVAM